MKIAVRVKPGATRHTVERAPDGSWVVAVTARPTDGRANEAVCEALASQFNVPKTAVRILQGQTSRRKLIEIG